MKQLKRNKWIALLLPVLFTFINNKVGAQEDTATTAEVVKLNYYNENNNIQYLVVESLLKTGKKTAPLKNKSFRVYLDSVAPGNLVAKLTTDKAGKAKCFLPPILKTEWGAMSSHKFIATAPGKADEPVAELDIVKAKIQLDTSTADGARSITVEVKKYENGEWIAASEVEMKIGVQRLGSILSAGDEATYTTDSSGSVSVLFLKDSLPGDVRGNFVLAASVEDNDQFGNLSIAKVVPWGAVTKPGKDFFAQRTLWTTRFKTPLWLLFIAYSIVLTVWGTLVYLILQLLKIIRLGKSSTA
ncbi:MAG: hypothetical protein ABI688_09075 [Bacteroidota bacterium]